MDKDDPFNPSNSSKHPRRLVTEVLSELIEQLRQRQMSFGDITLVLGDRTFGVLLFFVGLLNFVPGISLIFGPVMALVGFQLLVGKQRPWLPKRVTRIQVPSESTIAVLEKLRPWLAKLESYLKPRWGWTELPPVDNIIGLLVITLGLIITIPVPFSNVFPGLIVSALGLGLAARDGLIQVAAFALGCLAAVALGSLSWIVITRLFL